MKRKRSTLDHIVGAVTKAIREAVIVEPWPLGHPPSNMHVTLRGDADGERSRTFPRRLRRRRHR